MTIIEVEQVVRCPETGELMELGDCMWDENKIDAD